MQPIRIMKVFQQISTNPTTDDVTIYAETAAEENKCWRQNQTLFIYFILTIFIYS